MTLPHEWLSESDAPKPAAVSRVGDELKADDALRRVRRGEYLLYTGDFHNARQLLGAMGRRLKSRVKATTPLEVFRAERKARAQEHDTLGRVVVELDRTFATSLKRAPDTRQACREAWGAPSPKGTLVALKTLLGVLGAHEWRKKGLPVPGLKRPLVTHYGVYVPTRTDYVDLLRRLDDVKGARCFDIGTGTGVLSLVLLQLGARSVVATDLEPRAVECAKENAKVFGVESQLTVEERPLFPQGRADLVVCNPPWVPEAPKNRVDRAVFDEGGAMLEAFLEGVPAHLALKGRGVLLISNLAELLGLRAPGALEAAFARHGLTCVKKLDARARHQKAKDTEDALYAVRSKEVVSLYVLQASA